MRYGVNLAAGDIDGDGSDEVITGAGPGAAYGPHVRAWNYDSGDISQMPEINFFAYPFGRYGTVVGAADVDNDGKDELLTLPGPGPSNRAWLRAWDVNVDGVELDEWNWSFDLFDPWMTHGGKVAGSKNGWE